MEYTKKDIKKSPTPVGGSAMYNVQKEHESSEEESISKREAILLAKKKRLQRQKIGSRPVPSNLK